MSKSVKRVQAALIDAGLEDTVQEMSVSTKSAQDAASALNVDINQIAKSIVMQGKDTGNLYLFVTAGGNRVSMERASVGLGEEINRADAATIRKHTGFAIGGVAPIGHISPVQTVFDRTLAGFSSIWAAAGTPRHMFEIRPSDLIKVSKAKSLAFIETAAGPTPTRVHMQKGV